MSDTGNQSPDMTIEQIQVKYPQIVNVSYFFYNLLIQNKHKEDESKIKCDICLQLISEDRDQLVICEGCLGSVHQGCYLMEL